MKYPSTRKSAKGWKNFIADTAKRKNVNIWFNPSNVD
jgi:hypothetical protein